MNYKNLNAVVSKYLANFETTNNEEHTEYYKWYALDHFQKHWNIDADDFGEMFKESMSEMSNLIDNVTVQPIGGIRLLLKNGETEFVRESFKKLFVDDGGNINARQNRCEEFMSNVNEHIEKYVHGSWKYPQKLNKVIYYLNLWKPSENYIYKSSEAVNWANCIEYGDDFGSGRTFSLEKYYKMCDETRAELLKFTELTDTHKTRFINGQSETDDDFHILVYDMMYCANHYHFYKDMTILKVPAKERKTAAEHSRKLEEIDNKIRLCKDQLSELNENYEDLHIEYVGTEVHHKIFKTGTIIAQNENICPLPAKIDTQKRSKTE